MAESNFAPCTYPGCNTLVRGGRCVKHPYPIAPREYRASAAKRGYNHIWASKRERFLQANPVCQYQRKCRGDKATEVDHVLPLSQGGTHDESNLKAACKRCHSHKTVTQDIRRKGGKFAGKRKPDQKRSTSWPY